MSSCSVLNGPQNCIEPVGNKYSTLCFLLKRKEKGGVKSELMGQECFQHVLSECKLICQHA